MPIYDYSCTVCKHLVEVIHGINDAGPRFCPSCGAEGTMRKGFTTPAVHFKGSGWAKKDRSATSSPGRSSSGKSGQASADSTESSSKAESTSESKPDSKSDSPSLSKAATPGSATSTDGGT